MSGTDFCSHKDRKQLVFCDFATNKQAVLVTLAACINLSRSLVDTLRTVWFKIKIKIYNLLTQCIHMFCMDLRTNIDCFPIQREFSSIQRNPNF